MLCSSQPYLRGPVLVTELMFRDLHATCPDCGEEVNEDGLDHKMGICSGCGESWDEESLKNADPERFFINSITGKGKTFSSALVAEDIWKKGYRFFSTDLNGSVYRYNEENGIWIPDGDKLIAKETKKRLRRHYTSHRFKETCAYIVASSFIDKEKIGGNKNKIVMLNGVYDLEKGTLGEFDPLLYEVNQIPIEYDPDAKCPNIEKFLKDVVSSIDVDKLIEIPGYCLYKDYPIARIIILTGLGENGKSVYLFLLKTFLGKDNVSSVELQKLSENDFRASTLQGKLANICGDIPAKALSQTGFIKILSGRDSITSEKKFKDPFTWINYAKLIFSANELPLSYDDTIAFYRRMIDIPFINSFSRDNPYTDLNIIEKLTTSEELSGFFNLAVKGLRKLLENKGFSEEASTETKRIEYIRNANPIQYFAEKRVEKDTASQITKEDLYSHYVDLCEELEKIPKANNVFSREVRRFLPYISESKIEGGTIKVWNGIKVKDSSRMDETDGTVVPSSSIYDTFPQNSTNKINRPNSPNRPESTSTNKGDSKN